MTDPVVDWLTEEQLRRELADARARLDELRQTTAIDLSNAHNDLVAKNRRISALEAELSKLRDEDDGTAEGRDVRELLELYRRWVRGGNKKVNIKHPSRIRDMLKLLKLYGRVRCENAIRGMVYDEWAMGRSPRSKRAFNEIKHMLEADRFEHFERLWEVNNPERSRQMLIDTDATKRAERHAIYRFYSQPGEWPPITKVLNALHERGRQVVAHEHRPDSWSAQCPAHVDRDPSLSIVRKPDGMLLVKCWAGCDVEDVMRALGLGMRDLFANAYRDVQAADYAVRRRGPSPELRRVAQELYRKLAEWGDDESEGETGGRDGERAAA